MLLNTRVVHKRRETITALPLYHSGHLKKKCARDKDFKGLFGELRGDSLFLYTNDAQETYSEKLDLTQLECIEPESPNQKTGATFTLCLLNDEVQLKFNDAKKAEEWRGYILTVARREIPSQLELLPGQFVKLQDILTMEKRRAIPQNRPPLPPRLPPRPPHLEPEAPRSIPARSESTPEIPECFYDVTRQEAERMLEEQPENGGIILRPSAMTNNYALTIRQQTPRGPIIKNYRVTATNSGFVIELDEAVTVSSLQEVLNYFLEKTDYRVHPYVAFQTYQTRIEAVPPPPPPPASKAVPKAQVAPMLRSQTRERLNSGPEKQQDGEYVYPDDHKFPNHLRMGRPNSDGEPRKQSETLYTDPEEDFLRFESLNSSRRNSAAEWGSSTSSV